MSTVTGFVECYCGRRAVIRTSWTDMNPGRRFSSCRDYNEDPPICRRAQAVIPGLLRKKNDMELEILKLKSHNKRLFKLFCLSCLVCFICIWLCFDFCMRKDERCTSLKMKMVAGKMEF
ncbi:UNVERIFIED_CONTAM: hypothetical protein Slati_1751000 [Sesamum latifolium]|uniref:Zinc finger GRF-type domain-containing protein n=1 Tax=Sesamum latifolium TaxID=2727402 RepID=A0AAW2X2F0_9LAMI